MTDGKEIVSELDALKAEARANGFYLHCSYQDIWMTPDQLDAENKAGRFRWSAENWRVRDPAERTARLENAVKNAQDELDSWRVEVSAYQARLSEKIAVSWRGRHKRFCAPAPR